MDSPGVTYRIHYLLDQSDKSQIVHYNRLRPYQAPVPDRGRKALTCDSLQPQLPCLTALSGALPFESSKLAAKKSYNLSGHSSSPSLAPPTGHPQPPTTASIPLSPDSVLFPPLAQYVSLTLSPLPLLEVLVIHYALGNV